MTRTLQRVPAKIQRVTTSDRRVTLVTDELQRSDRESRASLQAIRSELKRVAASDSELKRVAASDSEMQRVAASCSELQRVAASDSDELQRVTASDSELQRVAASRSESQRVTASHSESQRVAASDSESQRVTASRSELQRVAGCSESQRVAASRSGFSGAPAPVEPPMTNRHLVETLVVLGGPDPVHRLYRLVPTNLSPQIELRWCNESFWTWRFNHTAGLQ
ncbi:unnamed protein product [Pleuronectes platessa]|uniref:Uncharacterized protein n=1 Tax=Pleuronectes platessa TaxID=8262 RepID=A0A9N7YTZ0_PLEPL|nr:unnamed protein product [Pleuronectes platessa]